MASPFEQVDIQCEPITGFASDKSPWPGTRRWARPVSARLDSRPLIGRSAAKIGFVWRPTIKCGVRTIFVVPCNVEGQLVAEFAMASHKQVLNAFRHQRINHKVREPIGEGGACAQRLSASTNKSLELFAPGDGIYTVLNAFRHQRINHIVDPGQQFKLPRVLNAFRHQRINHT